MKGDSQEGLARIDVCDYHTHTIIFYDVVLTLVVKFEMCHTCFAEYDTELG